MIRRSIIPILLLAAGFALGYFTQLRPVPHPAGPLTFDAIAQKRLPSVELHKTTFGGAVKYVHEVTGVDVAARWPFDSAGIDYQAPFDPDLSFRDVTVGQFIGRLNEAVAQQGPPMRIGIRDGFLIATPDGHFPDFGSDAEADWHNVTTCIYNVESLITHDGPWEQLAIPGPFDDVPLKLPLNMISREDLLTRTVMELIARDSWKDKGGTSGSMRLLHGYLIVTHTPPAQRAIYEVIKTLRGAK
ncbi:MAG TPA: hypothetical protein VFE47_02380 [Tepidisphaeraceae bacterium]|jgi:hypothetical protein|nr:hypothetical protein [Tepidisphaeraceae bacterium]